MYLCKRDLSQECKGGYKDCTDCVLDKIKAEIIKYECDCRLSDDEYPSCKQCTDSVFGSTYEILDKHKVEARNKE